MTYSQLREKIDKEFGKTQTAEALLNGIMTAIDTYLEEKAVEVVGKRDFPDYTKGNWPAETETEKDGYNTGLEIAAAIIRSKE